MGLLIFASVFYAIIALCIGMAAFDLGEDEPLRLGVFWPLLAVKWFLKTLWSVLVYGWFAE